MKCTNCGFDAENNAVCPICGTQLQATAPEPAVEQNANPYTQQAPQTDYNPYAQQNHNQNEPNPYAQPSPRQQWSGAPANSAPANPYIQQNNAPVQPNPYAQTAAQQYPQQPYNTPNAPAQSVPTARKRSKAAPIVVGSVIGVVILLGLIIAIFSTVITTHNIRTEFIDKETGSNHYYDDYYDDYSYDYNEPITFTDNNQYKLGETYQCDIAEVTLKSVEVTDMSKINSEKCIYALTVNIKNASNVNREFAVYALEIMDSEENYNDDFEYLYYEGDEVENVKAGESIEVIFYFRGPKNYGEIYPRIEIEDYTTTIEADYYSASIMVDFRVDLSDMSETTPETTTETTAEATKATEKANE